MIDYMKIARIATARFKWLPPESKEDMVGHILVGFSVYLKKPNPIMIEQMFTVIARRWAIDWWDKNKKHFRTWRIVPYSLMGADGVETDDFENLIKRLRPRDKELLRLYYRDGMTLDEIGRSYNLTREGIRVAIFKAIQKIRRRLGHDEVQGGSNPVD